MNEWHTNGIPQTIGGGAFFFQQKCMHSHLRFPAISRNFHKLATFFWSTSNVNPPPSSQLMAIDWVGALGRQFPRGSPPPPPTIPRPPLPSSHPGRRGESPIRSVGVSVRGCLGGVDANQTQTVPRLAAGNLAGTNGAPASLPLPVHHVVAMDSLNARVPPPVGF